MIGTGGTDNRMIVQLPSHPVFTWGAMAAGVFLEHSWFIPSYIRIVKMEEGGLANESYCSHGQYCT